MRVKRLEQKKLKTIPTKRREFFPVGLFTELISTIKAMLARAPMMAQTLTSTLKRPAVSPNTSAVDAAKAAPEETPRVKGLAR
jgi:hypothetical protein